ncbi:class I SAM-dependent methyltransferase [Myceligenerans pegani]|uniref:Methyltransferase domain-containing protein n=1 Tax=Myceligenerans pegani TaxID=2776917 RepID=A0ABR9MW22_9MICO|nr:methyltransferase domain-containing protein [Myceligenerans sp. TRM 65318]MBE1875580.1 methyltransferase domain-containing protein [Myceligenerans sp. TRM 65318]MBE3017851.1 methyltransferase domain-containing protein [Myceligenerans sp. TRM 65318]
MTETETYQISLEAAEVYESRFVPAIFAEWAPLLVDSAAVRAGQAVLDVACGTGIVARTAADRMGDDGAVVGLDLNEAMLTVARRIRPDLRWQQGDAADLPFPDRAFDVALCQMSLMFMPDRARAVAELARVTRAGGTVGIVVPAGITEQPAYRRLVDVAVDEAGPDAASLLDAYWSCGDLGELRSLFTAAGLHDLDLRTHLGTARFGSVDEMVATEVEGSPLGGRIDDATYGRIRERARSELAEFENPDGVAAPLRGHVVVGHVAHGATPDR